MPDGEFYFNPQFNMEDWTHYLEGLNALNPDALTAAAAAANENTNAFNTVQLNADIARDALRQYTQWDLVEEDIVVASDEEEESETGHDLSDLTDATSIYIRGLAYFEVKCQFAGYIDERDVSREVFEMMNDRDIIITRDTKSIYILFNNEILMIPENAYMADVCYVSVSAGWENGFRRPLTATISVDRDPIRSVLFKPTSYISASDEEMGSAFDEVYA